MRVSRNIENTGEGKNIGEGIQNSARVAK